MSKITTLKGTHDILPWDVHAWQKIEDTLRDVFRAFSYKEIRTPIFEKTQLFARGVGEFTDIVSKEMYTFEDKGEHSLTLRPELTASVARSYIQHHFEQQSPLNKLWYIGPLFRQERPQAGRQRQFHQFGVEVLGSPNPEADAEVMSLACAIYEKLGLKNWKLHINSIGSNETRSAYMDILKKKLTPHIEEFCPTCRERFNTNILRLFDCKNESCQNLMKNYAPSILDHLSHEDRTHFEKVKHFLTKTGHDFVVDNTLVRGLDYYTRTTFEIKGTLLGAQDALCGGGRYDKLITDLGGKDTPAIGFAAGMERLILAMKSEDLIPETDDALDLYIAPMDSESYEGMLPFVSKCRNKGISVHMDMLRRSVKAMMRDANRQNAKFTIVAGSREIASHAFRLKNMTQNETYNFSEKECIDFLLRNHHTRSEL